MSDLSNYREGGRRSTKLSPRTLQGAASPPGQASLPNRSSRPGQVHDGPTAGQAERICLLRGGLFPPAQKPLHPSGGREPDHGAGVSAQPHWEGKGGETASL